MLKKSKDVAQVGENISASSRKSGRHSLPSAYAAVQDAASAEEAFYRLQSWAEKSEVMAATAAQVEEELFRGGMELQRRMLDEHIRNRGRGDEGEALIEVVTSHSESEDEDDESEDDESEDDEPEERRLGHRRLRTRQYESIFGTLVIERQGYGAPGCVSIHPLDEQLNLPRRRYSYLVQKHCALLSGRGPFIEAVQQLAAMTGARVPNRQMEEIVKDAAVDFESFYKQRSVRAIVPDDTGSILCIGVDCKGVPKRKSPEEKTKPRPVRLKPGEKRTKKKMATVASVHTTKPYVRTADEVVECLMEPKLGEAKGEPSSKKRPRPENRRLWASLHKSKDEVFDEIVDEMRCRDEERQKTAVCVMDGERALQHRALSRLKAAYPELLVILDIMHALEYLWKAAYVFHPEDMESARLWVKERLRGLLNGNVSRVVAGMRQSATKQELDGDKREPVDTACRYFLNNREYMRYDQYLQAGLPIASGAVEGACGHLVKDRMEITGALWDVGQDGAEAVLKIRALDKSGDFEDYWAFHTQQELHRRHNRIWRPAF